MLTKYTKDNYKLIYKPCIVIRTYNYCLWSAYFSNRYNEMFFPYRAIYVHWQRTWTWSQPAVGFRLTQTPTGTVALGSSHV